MTGSHGFGSSQRLGRRCLWLATLPVCCIGSAEVPLCHYLSPLVSRASHDVDVPVHYPLHRHFLGNVSAECSNYDLVIILDSPWCRHPDGFAELDMSLYDPCLWVCRQLLALDPAVLRTPPFFQLILTFSYCLYDFLREQELGTGGSPIMDKAVSFHGQIKRSKLNVFAPDSQYAMELWALRPHGNFVKVICAYVFFHQYVANLRDERLENVVLLMSALRDSQPDGENYVLQSAIQTGKSENIFRTVSTSPLVFNMTVMRRSGAIRLSPDVPVGQLQPLTTVVSCTDAGITVTPFVVPPPDIEQPCRQLQDFLTCRTPESRQPSLLCSLSAVSSAHTLPQKLREVSSFLFLTHRFQPLRRESSHPTGDALLPPPPDSYLFQCDVFFRYLLTIL